MKKTLLSYVLLMSFFLLPVVSNAQKRIVLYEILTSNTCSPCKGANEWFDAEYQGLEDRASVVKYHVWFPSPGNDVMCKANEAEIRKRTYYYFPERNLAAPTFLVDGFVCSSYYDAFEKLEEREKIPAPFNLTTDYSVFADGDSVALLCSVTALQDMNVNARLYVNILEELITDQASIGTNGETEFTNVQRRMAPDSMGFVLPEQLVTGQELQFTSRMKIDNFYNPKQLAVVSFIQNVESKEVYQSFYAPSVPQTEIDARLVAFKETPSKLCIPELSGYIRFQNMGSEKMKTADIHILINNTYKKIIPWQGDVDYREYADMRIPAITDFELTNPAQKNKVEVWIENVNGNLLQSKSLSNTFTTADANSGNLEFVILTDQKPEEITWNFTNGNGEVVYSGGPYDKANTIYKIPVSLVKQDCYVLSMNDSGKDGLSNGYVKLFEMQDGKRVKEVMSSTYKTEKFSYPFSIQGGLSGIDEMNAAFNITISPNPAKDYLSVKSEEDLSNSVLRIYNSMSVKVMETSLYSFNENNFIDISSLPNGVYFVQVSGKTVTLTHKIIVKH